MKPIPKEITDLKAFNKWAGDPNNWIEKSKMKTDENVEHNKMLKNHAHYNKRYLAGVITIVISSFLISQVASRFISSQDTWSKLGKKAFNIISFQVINWIAYKNMQSDRERQIIPVNFKDYVILPSLKKLAFFGALLGATAYISQRSPLSALSWKKPVTLF